MKKVITVGVFDYFHIGHLYLFEKVKKFGDFLIVAVQDGNSILKTKPNANVFYTTDQRIRLVKSLRVVDDVIVYQDVDKILPKVDFDVFAVGGDQTHEGFQRAINWCKENNKEVVTLSRTPGICSSSIKEALQQAR